MNENTHPLLAVQRTVRELRRMASDVADSQIAASKQLATVKTANPFTVVLDGATKAVPAHRVGSYKPTVGDRVFCEVYSRQVWVLGTFDTVPKEVTLPAKSSFVWSGAVVVPSGGVGDINPDLIYVPSGITMTLVQVFAIIGSGTSATIALNQNGSAVSGLTAMSVVPYSSVAAMTYTPSGTVTISNGDRIAPLVTAISGTPTDFSVIACYSVSQAL